MMWYYQPTKRDVTLLNFYVDKYENSINFNNTHVLAKELTADSLIESLIQGRVFVAFNSLVALAKSVPDGNPAEAVA